MATSRVPGSSSECSDGRRLLWEFKLTEADFGTAADDAPHRDKLTKIYMPRLQHLVEPRMLEPAYFFSRYQLLRNVSHLGAQDALILAIPRAHTRLLALAKAFVDELKTDLQARATIVPIEDLATACAKACADDARLQSHFDAFVHKYVLND
jgi:hypothetical protein